MSGHTNDCLTDVDTTPCPWAFLAKPFTAETLFRALQLTGRGR